MEKYRIGLEISDKKLQLAVVAQQKNRWQLIEASALAVTLDSAAQILRQACRDISRQIRHAILGLPHHWVLMKEIRVDLTLTDAEIYQYLRQQAQDLFGKPADHWLLDYEIMPGSLRAAAAPRATAEVWLQICRKAGLQVQAVDVNVLALARLIHTCEDYQPEHPQALVWLKAAELVFIAVQNGRLIYVKRTPYSPLQPVMQALSPVLQFFNGLYPQYLLANVLFLDENENHGALLENPLLKPAALNTRIWQTPQPVKAHECCSLGLAIYGY